jgi:small subunit ribosomal protein S13
MPRIAGVDIPADKPSWVALTYIYGVGPLTSKRILKEANIDANRRAKELSEEELAAIIGILDKGYLVEGALRRNRSNARTRKGPRKTVAGKKGVKELGK